MSLRESIERRFIGEIERVRGEGLLRAGAGKLAQDVRGFCFRRAIGEGHVMPGRGKRAHDRRA